MNIKRFFFAFAAAAAAIFASSCEQNLTPGGDGKISVAQTELSFEIDGGSKTVTLHAGMDWELQGYDDEVKQWLSINPASGKASDQDVTVTFTALANEGGNRSASITFYGNVLQKATPSSLSSRIPKTKKLSAEQLPKRLQLKSIGELCFRTRLVPSVARSLQTGMSTRIRLQLVRKLPSRVFTTTTRTRSRIR